jgi:hypothetical protein
MAFRGNDPPQVPSAWCDFSRFIGTALAALWIFGGMSFFFLRFSTIFYQANQAAIHQLLERMLA